MTLIVAGLAQPQPSADHAPGRTADRTADRTAVPQAAHPSPPTDRPTASHPSHNPPFHTPTDGPASASPNLPPRPSADSRANPSFDSRSNASLSRATSPQPVMLISGESESARRSEPADSPRAKPGEDEPKRATLADLLHAALDPQALSLRVREPSRFAVAQMTGPQATRFWQEVDWPEDAQSQADVVHHLLNRRAARMAPSARPTDGSAQARSPQPLAQQADDPRQRQPVVIVITGDVTLDRRALTRLAHAAAAGRAVLWWQIEDADDLDQLRRFQRAATSKARPAEPQAQPSPGRTSVNPSPPASDPQRTLQLDLIDPALMRLPVRLAPSLPSSRAQRRTMPPTAPPDPAIGDDSDQITPHPSAGRLVSGQFDHPVFEPLSPRAWVSLLGQSTGRRVELAAHDPGDRRVLLRYQAGQPALAMGRFGRGAIAIFNGSLSRRHTDIAIHPAWIVTLHRSLEHLLQMASPMTMPSQTHASAPRPTQPHGQASRPSQPHGQASRPSQPHGQASRRPELTRSDPGSDALDRHRLTGDRPQINRARINRTPTKRAQTERAQTERNLLNRDEVGPSPAGATDNAKDASAARAQPDAPESTRPLVASRSIWPWLMLLGVSLAVIEPWLITRIKPVHEPARGPAKNRVRTVRGSSGLRAGHAAAAEASGEVGP